MSRTEIKKVADLELSFASCVCSFFSHEKDHHSSLRLGLTTYTEDDMNEFVAWAELFRSLQLWAVVLNVLMFIPIWGRIPF